VRYTFFEFTNFKGIRAARLELSESSSARVYTLVGLNESGKTTILEAIDLFQAEEDDEVSPKELSGWVAPDPHWLMPISERTNFTGRIEIRTGIELDDDDVASVAAHLKSVDGYKLADLGRRPEIIDRYEYEDSKFIRRATAWDNLRGTGRTKQGKTDKELSHVADNPRWNSAARFLRSRLPTIWYFPNFLFDFPEKIYVEEDSKETPANQFYRALFQDILQTLPREIDLQKHIVERAQSDKATDRDNLQQVLLNASREVTETIVGSWNRIFKGKSIGDKQVRIDLGRDDSETTDELGNDIPGRLWVRFRLQESDGEYSIRERSLGFRWFFVYLLITTYRGKRRGSQNETLDLFDEPASNLHQTAQRALLASLGELSKTAVIIYTTHSHHLINPAWLGTTYVVTNRGLDPSMISADYSAKRTDITVTPYRQFAAHHPDQSHYFQPILDVLDYTPSDLELIADVAMVEGKSDFYLLSYYQRVVLDLPDTQRLRLLPGGGAGTLDDVIQLYIGWARPFVALLDSDRAGRVQSDRYVEKFGNVVAPHLVLLSEASGKAAAKGIESLLNDRERLDFQRLVDPQAKTYNKKTLWLGVQEALVAERSVKLTATTQKALDRVLSTLRHRLDAVR
jgi:hypothetical protein